MTEPTESGDAIKLNCSDKTVAGIVEIGLLAHLFQQGLHYIDVDRERILI